MNNETLLLLDKHFDVAFAVLDRIKKGAALLE